MSEEKHIHAELVKQLAEDCFETSKPWKRWQYRIKSDNDWSDCINMPMFDKNTEYRRKPRTININGFEVPEPLRKAPKPGTEYYFPDIYEIELYCRYIWQNHPLDIRNLERGLIHLATEAAIQHSKAMLSFTEIKGSK